MQRAKYDIGEQAVHRFALSAEDKATLELAEWVDNAFKGTLVSFDYITVLVYYISPYMFLYLA